ncbi:MAG: 5-oxoprolinase subunit PxpA [Arenimonas sp.]
MKADLDFNCDLGEGCGDDAAIIPLLSSANIACGFHAGDAVSMHDTVALCRRHGVAIGAHPSLPDREGFGRRELPVTPEAAYAFTLYQLGALAAIARAQGARVRHLKPHGALYNLAARERAIADAIAAATRDFDPELWLVGLSGSALTAAGEAAGLRVAHEVFAERRYEADGTLTPRSQPEAVIDELEQSLAQVRGLLREGVVIARTGERVALRMDTLCLHGDRPDAAAFARALRETLQAEGVRIRPLGGDSA